MTDEKNISESAQKKYEALREYLKELGSVAVAFSSGVDSTFLLKTARGVLGDRAAAVTARSLSFPRRELDEASDFCRETGIPHFIVQSEELYIEGFADNPANRCYLCKRELFEKIMEVAAGNGYAYVAEGSNMDDLGDYRPGLAAIAELGVKSPLREVGLTKAEIRELSKTLGLKTWNKQSFACLASRFPYGEKITPEKLSMVDRAEQLLLDLGFSQLRVRIHGKTARVEVTPGEIGRFFDPELRAEVSRKLHSYGFAYVSLDLDGYRAGSMNETLRAAVKNERS